MRPLRFSIAWSNALVVAMTAALAVTFVPAKPSGADPAPSHRIVVPFVSADGIATSPPTPPTPSTPAEPPAPGAAPGTNFRLSEVGIAPGPGVPAFVELQNLDAGAASPSGLVLGGGGDTYTLPPGIPGAAPGGLIVIVFDGGGATSGVTFHAARTTLPGASAQRISLLEGSTTLDQVGWGLGALAHGGSIDDPATGSVAARIPAGGDSGEPWALFGPTKATPGAPNPLPAVDTFATPDGAIFSGGTARLSWYSVRGATAYHVEVAKTKSFANSVADESVTADAPGVLAPENVEVGPLGAGMYYWRVTAMYPSGASAVSATLAIGIRGGQALTAASDCPPCNPTGVKQLAVPLIYQRKDTSMLQLENPTEDGPLAWDKPDADGQPTRPYCTFAAVAMLSHYYGGDLSVDFVHYLTFKDQRPGPELDLEERGTTRDEERRAIHEALGVDPGDASYVDGTPAGLDHFHKVVRQEIDAGRPMVGLWPGHTVLIIGYAEDDGFGDFGIVVQDGNGSSFVRGESINASALWVGYFTIPQGAKGAAQPKGVTADSDGDGVVDFDETDRFGTNPNTKDTDNDKVDDKQDIRAGVWDERYGYARKGPGRDIDGDGIPTELDPDSDNGGCLDGMEDNNGNGKFESGSETDNFDPGDDPCIGGTYRLYLDEYRTFSDGSVSHQRSNLTVTFSLQEGADGTLTGLASATHYIEGQLTGRSACPLIDQPRVTVSWGATLSGKISEGDLLGFTATPSQGPGYVLTTVGCGIPPQNENMSPVHFGGYGALQLTDGRYDEHLDLPLPPGATGTYTSDLHIHKPGH